MIYADVIMEKRRVFEQMKVNRYTIVEYVDSKVFVVFRRVSWQAHDMIIK